MAKQADVNRRDSADSRVYPRPRKFPTSSTCGCLRVTKGYAHAIGSKVPEEIPTRSRKFVAPFASVVGQTHEGRQHAWEKWDGNNRGVTAVVGRGGGGGNVRAQRGGKQWGPTTDEKNPLGGNLEGDGTQPRCVSRGATIYKYMYIYIY